MLTVQKVREFQGHSAAIYSIIPSWRPGHFLSCGSEKIVVEWNIQTGEGKAIAKAEDAIFTMLLDPERDLLLLGLQSGELVFAGVNGRDELRRVQVHEKGVFDIQMMPDGKHVLISGGDGKISVWSLDKQDHIHVQKVSERSVRTLAVSPGGDTIAAGASDHKIRIYDLGLNPVKEWTAHNNSVFRVIFSENGDRIISTGRDAQIRIWDTSSGFSLEQSIPAHMQTVNDLLMINEGKHLVSASMDKSFRIWNNENMDLLKVVSFEKNACHFNGINKMIWHEDHLFSCSDDRRVMMWELS